MHPPLLTPSRPLKWASALLRVLLWAVGGAWLLFGLSWGVLHGIIVPRIGEWRGELEAVASRAVGVPVRIGGIRAQTHGLVPSFELTQVRLLDASGGNALVLGQVLTSVSVASAWRLGFEQIVIDNPQLDVRRRTNGQWEVAGLPLQPEASSDTPSPVLDWLFRQPEVAIRSGQVLWTDEWRQQPPMALQQVDAVLRNQGRRHQARLDATPSGGLAGRLSLRADLRSPFLSLHPGRWTDWSGTAYAELPSVDLAQLARPAHLSDLLGLTLSSGEGALRLWVDVDEGQIENSTADLALTGIHAQFSQAPEPLVLNAFEGRVAMQRREGGWQLRSEPLTLETRSGRQWQQGAVRLWVRPGTGSQPQPGDLEAHQLSLSALHEVAAGLPLPGGMHPWLARLQPSGTVEKLRLEWVNEGGQWTSFHGRGRVDNLALAAAPVAATQATHPAPARPGFSGATIDFDVTQAGGQAKLSLARGQLSFPGVFENPVIPMDKLGADIQWQRQGDRVQAQFSNVRFANADLQGQASGSWRTSDPAQSPSGSRFPGILTLNGTLSKGRGEQVHRYLPLVVGADARAYVRASILSGQARDVRFRVSGDLWQMPFANPADGEFHVAAKINQVDFAFAPPHLSAADQPRWPMLHGTEGELVFDRTRMSLTVSSARVSGAPGLRVSQARAQIANLSSQGVVEVSAQLDGPLGEALSVVNSSPLANMTGQVLQQARATGPASLQLKLAVPLIHSDQTTVQGALTLAGNDIQLLPTTPLLGRVRGRVEFTEQGLQVTPTTARLLGGEVLLSGTVRNSGTHAQFQAQGQATAEGLRQAALPGPVRALAAQASGSVTYKAELDMINGQTEWRVQSGLQGLALDWPAPFHKPADETWPLQISTLARPLGAGQGQPAAEVLQVKLSAPDKPLLDLTLHLDSGRTGTAVRRGLVLVGQAVQTGASLPASGLVVRAAWPTVDAEAWEAALSGLMASAGAEGGARDTAGDPPLSVTLSTDQLTTLGRTFHQVQLDGARQGNRWQGRVQAREASGQLDYQGPSGPQGAQLVARLDRLTLNTQSTSASLAHPTSQPASIPSLDVEVKALELDGLALGQLELKATNRPTSTGLREWRLTRLNLAVPEALLTATGNWVPTGASSGNPSGSRRTALTFQLDVRDSGQLLSRIGMPGLFRGGKGQLEGTLAWLGAPYALHTPSLTGQIRLDVTSGQFLKADPGLAKLLGVLSLQSLPRRLALDFRDVFSQGFAFDFVRGDARIEQGVAVTNNLQMKDPNAAVLMEGKADIVRETQDIRAVVVPEINAGTASLIATVINPAVGLGSFLAQAILRQPLIQVSTQSFRIHGPWNNPVVEALASPTNADPEHTLSLPLKKDTP